MKSLRKFLFRSAALGLMLGSAATALAVPPPAAPEPSREMREKMAQIHEQMAACLRSDRPLTECRTEMMHQCHAALGYQGCRMMQRHGMMGGPMGGGRRMMPPPEPPSPPTPPPPASPPPPQ